MNYLTKRSSQYYFVRRVPNHLQHYDPRKVIRQSLKTDSKTEAAKQAVYFNDRLEAYWKSLVSNNENHNTKRYNEAVNIASAFGFSYTPVHHIAQLPIEDLFRRILAIQNSGEKQIEAVLGAVEEPQLLLRDAFKQFWNFVNEKTLNKTPHQLRKWRVPREKAMEDFATIVTNKGIKSIDRNDTLKYKQFWIDRIKNDKISPATANKNLSYVRTAIETISDNLGLKLNTAELFSKLTLSDRHKKKRASFTTDQILAILTSDKLNNLNDQARYITYAVAETGARPSEITGLLPEDIILNAPIPYISIKDRPERPLKNANSARIIPLTGYSLLAFQKMPNGFPRYRDSDYFTNTTNKFLRENKLMPTEEHSIYSFRHSFQNRLLATKSPDRIQADLMGHKFHRPDYGDGATVEQKLECLSKTCLLN